jgi:SSS family solute:Na+ symporter
LLTVSRAASVGAGVLGILLAIVLPSIIAAVKIFYGLIAVSLFVPMIAGLYSQRVLSSAALTSIAAALIATIATMLVTGGRSLGLLSPEAVGIVTAAIVMIGFRIFNPGHAEQNVSFAGGTDSR